MKKLITIALTGLLALPVQLKPVDFGDFFKKAAIFTGITGVSLAGLSIISYRSVLKSEAAKKNPNTVQGTFKKNPPTSAFLKDQIAKWKVEDIINKENTYNFGLSAALFLGTSSICAYLAHKYKQ